MPDENADDRPEEQPADQAEGDEPQNAESGASPSSAEDTTHPTGGRREDTHDAARRRERAESQRGAHGGERRNPNVDEGEEFDAEKSGEQEARAAKENAPGRSEAEKTENAYRDKAQSLNNFQQERRETNQQIAQAEEQVSQVEAAIERVESAPKAKTFYENIGAGVMEPFSPADRDELLERKRDELDSAEELLENKKERARAVERGLLTNRFAMKWLEQHYEDLSGTGGGDGGGGGGGNGVGPTPGAGGPPGGGGPPAGGRRRQ